MLGTGNPRADFPKERSSPNLKGSRLSHRCRPLLSSSHSEMQNRNLGVPFLCPPYLCLGDLVKSCPTWNSARPRWGPSLSFNQQSGHLSIPMPWSSSSPRRKWKERNPQARRSRRGDRSQPKPSLRIGRPRAHATKLHPWKGRPARTGEARRPLPGSAALPAQSKPRGWALPLGVSRAKREDLAAGSSAAPDLGSRASRLPHEELAKTISRTSQAVLQVPRDRTNNGGGSQTRDTSRASSAVAWGFCPSGDPCVARLLPPVPWPRTRRGSDSWDPAATGPPALPVRARGAGHS